LLVRELDERLGFSALITENIMDDRRGRTLSCRSMIAGARDETEIMSNIEQTLISALNSIRICWCE
jgi:hypothetical protein